MQLEHPYLKTRQTLESGQKNNCTNFKDIKKRSSTNLCLSNCRKHLHTPSPVEARLFPHPNPETTRKPG